MKNNEQHKVVLDVYTGLQVCIPNLKDLPAPLNDFGLSGKAITYSMTILGAYSSEVLGQYMQKQGISDKTNVFYKYKLMGNFGMLSYLYKKAENKSNERAIGEVIFETGVGIGVDSIIKHRHTIQQGAKKIAAKTTTKLGISLGSRILAGATTGAVVGSSAPIVGTIVGAVAGAFLAGIAEDFFFGEGWFEDKDKKRELQQQERENRLYKIYITKINQIGDYLLRHKYIEKRILKDYESDELCRSINNPNESYFKTILLMLSFHNYLDKDTEFYKSLQSQDTQKDSKEIESNNTESKKEILIQPIANAIPLRLEIQECYDSSKGALLKDTTIYIYNHRFQRVVAKGRTDSKGSLQIDTISVGQEIGIDKLSFIVDRDNLSESNFELSKTQYATITNIQTKHKQAKEYTANKIYLGFNDVQSKLKADYEVIRLHAQKGSNAITFTPQINTTDMRYKQYTQFAYMTFNVMDFGIDEYIANISIKTAKALD